MVVGCDFESVERKEHFHHQMSRALVAVHKRVILYHRKTEGRCFFDEVGLEILGAKCHARLCQGGFQSSESAHRRDTGRSFHQAMMEFERCAQCDIPHHASRR
jgi:hypothetical protein